MAHEIRSRGARPGLADKIARVISERRKVESFEVSLCRFNNGADKLRVGSEEIISDDIASNNGRSLIQSCLNHAGIMDSPEFI